MSIIRIIMALFASKSGEKIIERLSHSTPIRYTARAVARTYVYRLENFRKFVEKNPNASPTEIAAAYLRKIQDKFGK